MDICKAADDPATVERFEAMRAMVLDAGAMAADYFSRLEELTVETKTEPQDVVSIADREVEQFLRARVKAAFGDDGFYGEELGREESRTGFTWVVDPIDGTGCFLAGIPIWCVSVALVHGDQVVAGYIYDPNRNELFSALAGQGVFLNGRRVNVRRIPSIATGFFGVGACHRVPPDGTLSSIRNLLAHGGMYLRTGSAALMLAYVSCGRLIGYYENHLMPWDCMAGLLLVREGGGRTNAYFDNDGYGRGNVVCAWTPDIDDVVSNVFDLSQPVRLVAGQGT